MAKFIQAMAFLLCLSGCSTNKSIEKSKLDDYQVFYKAIEENKEFLTNSDLFTISGEIKKDASDKYIYYVFIDNAQVAMYDIKAMVIEEDTSFETGFNSSTSLGIYDNTKYALVPYQINSESGYYKGLMLSGVTDSETKTFEMLLTFYKSDREKQYRQFIKFTLSNDGITLIHDDIGE